jgi:hypothetical protein
VDSLYYNLCRNYVSWRGRWKLILYVAVGLYPPQYLDTGCPLLWYILGMCRAVIPKNVELSTDMWGVIHNLGESDARRA